MSAERDLLEGVQRVDSLLLQMRAGGWSVAVHNDYRLQGRRMTFWLFTHASGRWAKGEGATDVEALSLAIECAKIVLAGAEAAIETAERRGRAKGLEEAAKAADRRSERLRGSGNCERAHALSEVADDLRALARAVKEEDRG